MRINWRYVLQNACHNYMYLWSLPSAQELLHPVVQCSACKVEIQIWPTADASSNYSCMLRFVAGATGLASDARYTMLLPPAASLSQNLKLQSAPPATAPNLEDLMVRLLKSGRGNARHDEVLASKLQDKVLLLHKPKKVRRVSAAVAVREGRGKHRCALHTSASRCHKGARCLQHAHCLLLTWRHRHMAHSACSAPIAVDSDAWAVFALSI